MKDQMIGKLVMDKDGSLGIVIQMHKAHGYKFYDIEYLNKNSLLKVSKKATIDYATLQFWLDNYLKYRKAINL